MKKTHDRVDAGMSVFDAARERLRRTFDKFDTVVVSFSGGKDSTAVLNLAAEVAADCGKLPLRVFTYDEEAIPPETVDYCERVAARPGLDFSWYCLPVEHRNACSRSQPFWHPWAEECRDRWVRPLPPLAITHPPAGFNRQPIPDVTPMLYGPKFGTVGLVMGIRCQESMTRLRAVIIKKGFDAFLSGMPEAPWVTKVYPIYDWTVEDVWVAPKLFGWDYNRAYDLMEAAGVSRSEARCSPPYGEQPIRRLWSYKICWPELWAKMVDRVPGAATAARYANTELYGIGLGAVELKLGETWQKRVMSGLKKLDPDSRAEVAEIVSNALRRHRERTGDLMPDDEPHERSGYCWKHLFPAVAAGGNKLGRQGQKVDAKALSVRLGNGYTW